MARFGTRTNGRHAVSFSSPLLPRPRDEGLRETGHSAISMIRMAKQSARTTSNRSLKLHGADGDGNRISNHILLSLAHDESEKVFAALEYVRLNTHHVLHDAGDTVKSAYFCNSGLISVVSVFPDGKSVEVGLVGKEGFVGSPLVAGFRTAYTRAIVQVDATAFRVNAEKLSTLLRECPEL